MGHIARFPGAADLGEVLERGRVVVVQSNRGMELGEVLTACDETILLDSSDEIEPRGSCDPFPTRTANEQLVRRAAETEDLERAKLASESRDHLFSRCRRILAEHIWPWDLLDVEPLLDGETVVLHYLGPYEADATSVRARFRVACNLNVLLEHVGIDIPLNEPDAVDERSGCGSDCQAAGCGSGECGGGCQSSTSGSGCASCSISRWIADHRH